MLNGIMEGSWTRWWSVLLVLNATSGWLLTMALAFATSAGPVNDSARLTRLERGLQKWSRISNSVFTPKTPPLRAGTQTSQLIRSFRGAAEDMWRANRGAFLLARTMNQVGVVLGVSQLLLVFIACAFREGGQGMVLLAMAILGVNLVFAVATLMCEGTRWRRRAPFESQLVWVSLAALLPPRGPLTWSDARPRLARVERVLVNRFARATDQPASQDVRNARWWARIAPWGEQLAALDVDLHRKADDCSELLVVQLEAAHKAIFASRAPRHNRPTVAPTARTLDPQTRAGWLLLAGVGGGTLILTVAAAADFTVNTQAGLPSLEDVRSWIPAIGAAATAISITVSAIGWIARRLSAT
jgi:hypothetical protein